MDFSVGDKRIIAESPNLSIGKRPIFWYNEIKNNQTNQLMGTETLFDPVRSEIIRHHWTADEQHVMQNAQIKVELLQRIQRDHAASQNFLAGDLLEHDIPDLEGLLKIENLTLGQRQEVEELIRQVDETVPDSFELPKKN